MHLLKARKIALWAAVALTLLLLAEFLITTFFPAVGAFLFGLKAIFTFVVLPIGCIAALFYLRRTD